MSYCTRIRTHLVVAIFSLFLWMLSFAADPVPEHGRSSVQMTKAAQAFIESLDNEQRKATVFSLDVDERATWSNLPIIMVEPNGMLIGDMNEDQRVATHQLLRASLSSQGYAKFTGIMQLDDLLHEIETEQLSNDSEGGNDPFRKAFIATRSSGNYVVAIFGEPGAGAG